MTLAVMQPYLFPYAGYFQLVNCADVFIFYDDVSFIKGGWINRNQILNAAKPLMFTCPLSNASSNVEIKDVQVSGRDRFLNKFKKQLFQCYSNAPYFTEVSNLILGVFEKGGESISELAATSVIECSKYIGIECRYGFSSVDFANTKSMDRVSRLIEITKRNQCERYVNMPGGRELYNVEEFANSGVQLRFLNGNMAEYRQLENSFVPHLSVIDVLMFNSPEQVKLMLGDYQLGL